MRSPGPCRRISKLGLKLIADRATGKLLGAQAVGIGGAVSRINTLAAALWAGLTLDDVGWLDLAYAPPFSGSWDPIHIAAQTLQAADLKHDWLPNGAARD